MVLVVGGVSVVVCLCRRLSLSLPLCPGLCAFQPASQTASPARLCQPSLGARACSAPPPPRLVLGHWASVRLLLPPLIQGT